MGPIRGFLQLPLAKKKLIIEATGLIIITRLGLYLTSVQKLQSFYQRFSNIDNSQNPGKCSSEADIAWSINSIGQKLFKDDTCLVIAIAGQALLNYHGIPARLQLGCLLAEDKSIFAHAWVECEGEVVIGGTKREVSRYTPLTDIREVRI